MTYDRREPQFDEVEVKLDDSPLMLTWSWDDEGYQGDYDPDDMSDAPLLRFTVYRWQQYELHAGEYEPLDDASYCTENPIDTDRIELVKMGVEILREVHRTLTSDPEVWEQRPWKKAMERCSWITPARGPLA